MRNIFTAITFVVLLGCSAKSYSPQAKFSLPSSKENSIEARKVLHEIAIENNLTFEDSSHKYPSGTSTIIAIAERVDGLQLILLGTSETGDITVAVHCHENCKEWKSIFKSAKSRFMKQWDILD